MNSFSDVVKCRVLMNRNGIIWFCIISEQIQCYCHVSNHCLMNQNHQNHIISGSSVSSKINSLLHESKNQIIYHWSGFNRIVKYRIVALWIQIVSYNIAWKLNQWYHQISNCRLVNLNGIIYQIHVIKYLIIALWMSIVSYCIISQHYHWYRQNIESLP